MVSCDAFCFCLRPLETVGITEISIECNTENHVEKKFTRSSNINRHKNVYRVKTVTKSIAVAWLGHGNTLVLINIVALLLVWLHLGQVTVYGQVNNLVI